MNKKGVSIIILMVTTTVLGVLISVTLTQGVRSINASNLNLFKTDVAQIQEYILTNTETNKEVQTFALKETLTKADMLNRVGKEGAEFLNKEFIENNEKEESLFTQIDIETISNKEFSNGKGLAGLNDYYYISNVTNKVYYLQGVRYDNKMYYSLVEQKVDPIKKEEKKLTSSLVRVEPTAETSLEETKPSSKRVKPEFKIVDKGSFNLLYVIPTKESSYENVYLVDMLGKESNNQTIASKKIINCIKIPNDVIKIKVKIDYGKNDYEIVELDNITK